MTPTRPGTWLRILLVASLALNIAVVAGFAWHHFGARHDGWSRDASSHDRTQRAHRAPGMRGTMMPNPRVLRQVLPEERRVVVDALLAEHREQIRGNVREVFQARNEVHELLTAETVDAEALDAAFANLRARDAEAATAVQAMLTELATELTPEERRALAESIHRTPRRD